MTKLNCHNCKYWTYAMESYCSLMESYCSLAAGNNFTQSMHTCTPLTKKLNQIYFNRFIKENKITDKQLINNCKKIINIITYIYLDELRYTTLGELGPAIEFTWNKADIDDVAYNIRITKNNMYIQIYQMENRHTNKIHESFVISLYLDIKDFKEKEQVIKNTLWTTIAIYLQRFLDVRNTNKKVQDVFSSIIKK